MCDKRETHILERLTLHTPSSCLFTGNKHTTGDKSSLFVKRSHHHSVYSLVINAQFETDYLFVKCRHHHSVYSLVINAQSETDYLFVKCRHHHSVYSLVINAQSETDYLFVKCFRKMPSSSFCLFTGNKRTV